MDIERRGSSSLTVITKSDVIGTGLSRDISGGDIDIEAMSSGSDMSWREEESTTTKSTNGQRDHERELTSSGVGTANNVGHSFRGISDRDDSNENDEKESKERLHLE